MGEPFSPVRGDEAIHYPARETRRGGVGPYGAPPESGGSGLPGHLHHVLRGLAGRVDDDALAGVRVRVAVEDDAGAAELLGGALVADRVALTSEEREVLAPWFTATRVDPEVLAVLPDDRDAVTTRRHRFVAECGGRTGRDDRARLVARIRDIRGVVAVRECARTTPAGSASGPLPQPVLLVQTADEDDCEHVSHRVAQLAADAGEDAVEVVARGAALPPYHRDALAAAGAEGAAPVPAAPGDADEPAPGDTAEAEPLPAPPTATTGPDEVDESADPAPAEVPEPREDAPATATGARVVPEDLMADDVPFAGDPDGSATGAHHAGRSADGRVPRARHRGGEDREAARHHAGVNGVRPGRADEDPDPDPPTDPVGWAAPLSPDTDDDGMAGLSTRERELLTRLHDELASRERAEGTDPFGSPSRSSGFDGRGWWTDGSDGWRPDDPLGFDDRD